MLFYKSRSQLFLSLWFFSVKLAMVESFGPKSGPYDILLEKIESCEDEGTGQIKFPKKLRSLGNGKYVFSTEAYFGVPIDENFQIYGDLQHWSNGGYRPRFMQYTFKNCEEIWNFSPDVIKSVMKSSNRTWEHSPCPFPAGNYTLTDWEVELRAPNIPTMIYNKYRAVFTLLYNNVKVGCMMGYGEVVPKPT